MTKYKHLTKNEFSTIKDLLNKSYSINKVSKFADRSYSLVMRISDCPSFETYLQRYNSVKLRQSLKPVAHVAPKATLPKQVVKEIEQIKADDKQLGQVVRLLQEIKDELVSYNVLLETRLYNANKKKGWF